MAFRLLKNPAAVTLAASFLRVDPSDAQYDTATNYAFGGAWSDESNTITNCVPTTPNCDELEERQEILDAAGLILPGFTQQVDFLRDNLLDFDPDGDIIFVLVGLADFVFFPNDQSDWFLPYTGPNDEYPLYTAAWTLNNIAQNLETLYETFGPRYVFAGNLIESCPIFPGCNREVLLSQGVPEDFINAAQAYGPIWADGIEAGMQTIADDFNNAHPDAALTILDFRSSMKAVLDSGDYILPPETCVSSGNYSESVTGVGFDCPNHAFLDNSHFTSEVAERVVNEQGLADTITDTLPNDFDLRRMISFGDSFLDSGALFDTLTRAGISWYIANPPYYDGRSMNGYTFAEHLELAIGIERGEPFSQPSTLPTIVDLAVATEDLSTLVGLLVETGLADALAGEGPFTVFAPTNDAFSKLPADVLASLTDPDNVDDLINVLTYHVVSGAVIRSTDLAEGAMVTALNGETLTVTSLDPPTINESVVIAADILASNGVVHLIDTVLVPPAIEPTMEPTVESSVEPTMSEPTMEPTMPDEDSTDIEALDIIGAMVDLMIDIVNVLPQMLGLVQTIITAPARLFGGAF